MKYHGRISIPLVALIMIALWHISYFVINSSEAHTFLLTDGFIKYDFIYTPLVLPFFWWMGKKYDEARFYAVHDPLTGLYNRRFVVAKLPSMLERATISDEALHIFVIDIDHFKDINDTFGHKVGDEVLQTVARALLKIAPDSSLVVRWGGDEFLVTVFSSKFELLDSLLEPAQQILKDSSPLVESEVTMSIGQSIYPIHSTSADELIKLADERMYEHKRRITDIP